MVVFEAGATGLIEQVDFVHRLDQPVLDRVVEAEIDQHVEHIGPLRLAVRMMGVADVDDDIRFGDLLQGGPESGDQMGRQVGDKADRVGQDRLAARGQREAPHRRVERREQHVPGGDRGAGQPVEQRRLPGIGIADQRDHRIRHAAARLAMQSPCPPGGVELALQSSDPLADQPAVDFELAFARSAEKAEAAALALQMRPRPDEA